jgi:hypothetical protein
VYVSHFIARRHNKHTVSIISICNLFQHIWPLSFFWPFHQAGSTSSICSVSKSCSSQGPTGPTGPTSSPSSSPLIYYHRTHFHDNIINKYNHQDNHLILYPSSEVIFHQPPHPQNNEHRVPRESRQAQENSTTLVASHMKRATNQPSLGRRLRISPPSSPPRLIIRLLLKPHVRDSSFSARRTVHSSANAQ